MNALETQTNDPVPGPDTTRVITAYAAGYVSIMSRTDAVRLSKPG